MKGNTSFGYWVRRRRKALDLTQEVLARQVGCSSAMIRMIETDERRPSRQIAELLAEQLEVALEERAAFIKAARAELAVDRLAPPPALSGLLQPKGTSGETTSLGSTGGAKLLQLSGSRASLPSGTVTFLFTDIEGSCKLWERYGEAMRVALARHDELLRHVIAAHAGVVVKATGDGIHSVFARATDALVAALTVQRAFQSEDWGEVGCLRVRCALHTAVAEERDGDYFGPAVNRAARLMSAGHGGQVLLSRATCELVADHLADGATLRDLGIHRLKDLSRPEHIFQIVVPDLPANYPPLQTIDARPNNLHAQPTELIGREQEVATVGMLLRRTDVRLVTLTGSGGIGKTRLALQVAAELIDRFADGVWFVDLAPLSDPKLVIPTIVQTLGLKEISGQTALEQLHAYLHNKQLLLVLDNSEQVVDAARNLALLLATLPQLKVLVTSRVALRLRGEQEFQVPPLSLPDPKQLPSLASVSQYAAVALFVQQARAAKPDFQITDENAQAVVEICHRLDGLPLAIELAAARIKLFSPQALLKRLERRLDLLTSAVQDVPARQQTLRNTIDWSYNLLQTGEQMLFRWLAIFVGGVNIAAVEAVASELKIENAKPVLGTSTALSVNSVEGLKTAHAQTSDSIFNSQFSILNLLTSLVDNSLLHQEQGFDGEPRFLMLETIREYAFEKLVEQGECAALQRCHAVYYLALAERADVELRTADMLDWLARLNQENDNLRTALSWYQSQADESEANVRLAGALWLFWFLQGLLTEGRAWLHGALARFQKSHANVSAQYVWAVGGAGMLAWIQGDWSEATTLGETALTYGQQSADRQIIADALYLLSSCAISRGEPARAVELADECLALQRARDDQFRVGMALLRLGWLNHQLGMADRAQACMRECEAVSQSVGNPFLRAGILGLFAYVATGLGDDARARIYYEESLGLLRAMGEHYNLVGQLFALGAIAWRQRDCEQAAQRYREGLALADRMAYKSGRAQGMSLLGALARQQGELVYAQAYIEEGLGIFEELGDQAGVAAAQTSLGFVALHLDDVAQAAACFRAGIEVSQLLHDQLQIGLNIVGVAGIAMQRSQNIRAARLFGAAEHLLEAYHNRLDPANRIEYERIRDIIYAGLDTAALSAAQAAEHALPLEKAIVEAQDIIKDCSAQTARASVLYAYLS